MVYSNRMNKLNIKQISLKDRNLLLLKDDMFTISLEHNNFYEEHFTNFAKLVLKEGDVALDIGANLGYHTITMAELVGNTGMVCAFEPQRIIYQQLNANIFLNGLDNIYTFNVAVGDEFKTVYIDPPNYHNIIHMITNIGNTSINYNNGVQVEQIVLNQDINKLNFIKLDIQGSELNALKGMSENIKKYKPYIFIEIESKQLLKFNVNPEDLIKYIKYELKYNLYRIYVNDSSTKYNNYMTDDFICIPNDIFFDFEKYKYELLKYE